MSGGPRASQDTHRRSRRRITKGAEVLVASGGGGPPPPERSCDDEACGARASGLRRFVGRVMAGVVVNGSPSWRVPIEGPGEKSRARAGRMPLAGAHRPREPATRMCHRARRSGPDGAQSLRELSLRVPFGSVVSRKSVSG